MGTLPTVRVREGKTEKVINLSRYQADPDRYTLLKEKAASTAEGSGKKDGSKGPSDDLSSMTKPQLIEALEAAGGKLAEVEGTGKNGAVKNVDIVAAIEAARAAKAEGSQGE